MKSKFVKSEKDLVESVLSYNQMPEFWRGSVGGYPKYFVHLEYNGQHLFGLSKFCAFKSITLLDYVGGLRHETNGGTTQKIINKLANRPWLPYNQVEKKIRTSFDIWINSFFENYTKENSNFISIKLTSKVTPAKPRLINQDLLDKIGLIGEEVVLEHEKNRIGKKKHEITHISKETPFAGYDIFVKSGKEQRFIEVKASLKSMTEFFISSNEVETLSKLKDEAFLYLVEVIDIEKRIGKVIQIIKNPGNSILKSNNLKPIKYKVTLT